VWLLLVAGQGSEYNVLKNTQKGKQNDNEDNNRCGRQDKEFDVCAHSKSSIAEEIGGRYLMLVLFVHVMNILKKSALHLIAPSGLDKVPFA
jgi:hypothetical protein